MPVDAIRKASILVVEDNRTLALRYSIELQLYGSVVRGAHDVVSAKRAAREHKLDATLCNLAVPMDVESNDVTETSESPTNGLCLSDWFGQKFDVPGLVITGRSSSVFLRRCSFPAILKPAEDFDGEIVALIKGALIQ